MSGAVELDAFRKFFLDDLEKAYPEIERTDTLPEKLHRQAAEVGC